MTAYLAMSAQFESWLHPLTIMLTVPLAILGGILGLLVVGSSLNIYSQIALIILIRSFKGKMEFSLLNLQTN